MSSQTRTPREDGKSGLDVRTLAIASFSAAAAAIIVSRVWVSGTPIAAAATPVIVTILKEMLDRPTAKIAEKVTVPTRALKDTQIREPAASRVGRDAQRDEGPTRRLEPTEPLGPEEGGDPSDIRVYRQQPAARRWGRVNPKVVAATALLAFVIAGVVITAGQLAIGNPFGKDGNGAIILGQKKSSKSDAETERQNTTTEPQQTTPQDQERQQTTPQQQQQQTAPIEPEEQQPQQQRAPTPTTPQNTTTTPAPGTVEP